MKSIDSLLSAVVPLAVSSSLLAQKISPKVDVCVYGATPAGIVAAVSAKQEGCSVLILELGRWLVGSILGAGIKPMQDCVAPESLGGLTTSRVFKLEKCHQQRARGMGYQR